MKRILCAALGALLFFSACTREEQAPELLEPAAVSSDLAVVERGNMYDGTVLEGNIVPNTEELSFSTGGRVGEICVVLGEKVKKGDALLRLDTTAQQTRLEELTEQLEYARAMDEFDTREAQLNTELMTYQYGAYDARCRLYVNEQEAAARRRAAEISALEEQQKELEEEIFVDSVLTAPFSGTVAAIYLNVGDSVSEDAAAIVIANNFTCFLQTEFISESRIAEAAAVYATVGGVRYEVASIPIDAEDYISKQLSGKTVYSKFHLINAGTDLMGQYALLYLMTNQREQVLNIPINALLRDAEGYYVYVDRNGTRLRRDVEIGLKTAAQAEILSGVEEGESVYVVG